MKTNKKNFTSWDWNSTNGAGARRGMPLSQFAPPARELDPREVAVRRMRQEMAAAGAIGDPNLRPDLKKKIDACRDFSPFKGSGWAAPQRRK